MSHHLDSPASRRDPRLNLTDTYVFDGAKGTVFVLLVNSSLAGPDRPRGFHPEARYEVKVHFDDARDEELAYRITFDAAEADGAQRLTVVRLAGVDAQDDDASGTTVAEGPTGTTVEGPDGSVRVWSGPASDPFYLDLHQLGHVLEGLQGKQPIDLAEWKQGDAANTFAGSTVQAIVLEVTADPELRPGRDLGVWGVTELATDAGGWRQINRAAIPMVWPLFRALGSDDDSDRYAADSAAHPADDPQNDGPRIHDLVAAACAHTGTARPGAHADVVVRRVLPDLLPYTVGTPAMFGFAGFNGRALSDNAPEVMFSLVTNTAFPTGLDATTVAAAHGDQFPYVVPAIDA